MSGYIVNPSEGVQIDGNNITFPENTDTVNDKHYVVTYVDNVGISGSCNVTVKKKESVVACALEVKSIVYDNSYFDYDDECVVDYIVMGGKVVITVFSTDENGNPLTPSYTRPADVGDDDVIDKGNGLFEISFKYESNTVPVFVDYEPLTGCYGDYKIERITEISNSCVSDNLRVIFNIYVEKDASASVRCVDGGYTGETEVILVKGDFYLGEDGNPIRSTAYTYSSGIDVFTCGGIIKESVIYKIIVNPREYCQVYNEETLDDDVYVYLVPSPFNEPKVPSDHNCVSLKQFYSNFGNELVLYLNA